MSTYKWYAGLQIQTNIDARQAHRGRGGRFLLDASEECTGIVLRFRNIILVNYNPNLILTIQAPVVH